MTIKLTFLGAAGNVTGSSYLLETPGARILIDCGMFQEREFRDRNWADFHVPPKSIDAVILTHAHLDHAGLLPRLVKKRFAGTIFGTAATHEIARIVMLDSARIQEEDVRYKEKRHKRAGKKSPHPYEPLYRATDAEAAASLMKPVPYDKPVKIADGVEATFHDAGHILGSAMVKLSVDVGGESRTILFSGDVGRKDKPILRDPSVFEAADYILVESTYGNRVHRDFGAIDDMLEEIVTDTVRRGGNLVIPSFAIERAQELLYHLNALLRAKRIPPVLAFLDSPMAVRVTEVFRHHPDLFDEEMLELMEWQQSPFDFPGLKMSRTTGQSKAINNIKGSVIVIAGSGMCTGGRIKHHLKHNIGRPESTLLFIGFQAKGTLGRLITGGEETVRIHGRTHHIKSHVEQIHGFSAHADRDELLGWLSSITSAPKRVFVTHGEAETAAAFGGLLAERTGWKVLVPRYRESVTLA